MRGGGEHGEALVRRRVVGSRERVPSANVRAIVCCSGNANACTGEQGLADARRMAELVAAELRCRPEQVLVASTGVIGRPLPMPVLEAGIPKATREAAGGRDAASACAHAILTTDTGIKVSTAKVESAGDEITITGFAKGAAMIGPNMATMLGLMLTDAVLTPESAQRVLKAVADESFNCISVEGHTSTNDSLVLLASGAAGGAPLAGDDLAIFQKALTEACIDVAKQIPSDGEGATHLIVLDIEGCATRTDAR